MSLAVAEVRRSILLTLYKHETGERRHESGHHYLDPRALGPFLEQKIDDLFFQRVLRMMLDEGSVEMYGRAWVFRISDKGLLEAEQLVHGQAAAVPSKEVYKEIFGPNTSGFSIDWAKWGSIASIAAIPVAFIIWWFS